MKNETINRAATLIQSLFRGFMARNKPLKSFKENKAARVIQFAWRRYLDRQKIKRCRFILTTVILKNFVREFIRKRNVRLEYERLKSFDKVLSFYPAKSNKEILENPKTSRKKRRVLKKKNAVPKKEEPKKTTIALPIAKTPKIIPRSLPSRKRKVLIECPPPWHNRDPRKLSQTQKDEMEFNQKNNYFWMKNNITNRLLEKGNPFFDESDVLFQKNEHFCNREVQKGFIQFFSRPYISTQVRSPSQIECVYRTSQFIVTSYSCYSVLQLDSLSHDSIISYSKYISKAPYIDIIIHRFSGNVFAINTNWELVSLEDGKEVFFSQLEVIKRIPILHSFMQFDHFGMLWVNLLPQQGKLYCFDTLTLHTTLIISYHSLLTINSSISYVRAFLPLSLDEKPIGFAFSFSNTSDIVVFSIDFSQSKRLGKHKMDCIPLFKQINTFLVIWSKEQIIYGYELNSNINYIKYHSSYHLKSCPTDILFIEKSDFFLISRLDGCLSAHMAFDNGICSRIPNEKLSDSEQAFADKLLGPETHTTCRSLFMEIGVMNFTSTPLSISGDPLNSNTVLVMVAFASGDVGSVWVQYGSLKTQIKFYNDFSIGDPNFLANQLNNSFPSVFSNIISHRKLMNGSKSTLARLFNSIHAGEQGSPFSPNNSCVSILYSLMGVEFRKMHPFIPLTPNQFFSAYEAFYFFKRSDSLPSTVRTFNEFLDRFAPSKEKDQLNSIGIIKKNIPFRGIGPYQCIIDCSFSKLQISNVFNQSNSFFSLSKSLSELNEPIRTVSNEKSQTSFNWLTKYHFDYIQSRLSSLNALESIIKMKLLEKVMKMVYNLFQKSLFEKMQTIKFPVIPTSIQSKDIPNVTFSMTPNRNPLFTELIHSSIYQELAVSVLYGFENLSRLSFISYKYNYKNFEKIRSHINLMNCVTSMFPNNTMEVYLIKPQGDHSEIVLSEDIDKLPLSYYLHVHSFLGGDSRLISTLRLIISELLLFVHKLHSNNIICRTIYPKNISINPSTNSVSILSLLDSQKIGNGGLFLHLPNHFSDPSNPFLPPEYYHQPMSNYSTSFDIWQIGILLLYILTGQLPISYGSELMKAVKVNSNSNSIYSKDVSLIPPVDFFYDWLQAFPTVGENEKCSNEHGICIIQSQVNTPTSILSLEHYQLLPYKGSSTKYDESKFYLHVIAQCLQIDPKKRPTAETLLRTFVFNPNSRTNESLYYYCRMPNSELFLSSFIIPTLSQLSQSNYLFTIRIIESIIYRVGLADQQNMYTFPLDLAALESIAINLFSYGFIDSITSFIINRVDGLITDQYVFPSISFNDELFDELSCFFEKYITNIEKGSSLLIKYSDQVLLSLLALYTGNCYLRFESSDIINQKEKWKRSIINDSSAYFIYSHNKLSRLIRKSVSLTPVAGQYIFKSNEHNELYYDSIIYFGDLTEKLSRTLCISFEKSQSIQISSLVAFWQKNYSKSINRIFWDFKIVQKIMKCLSASFFSSDALDFFIFVLLKFKIQSYDPIMILLLKNVYSPSLFSFFDQLFSDSLNNRNLKKKSLFIINHLVYGASYRHVMNFLNSGAVFNIVDQKDDDYAKFIHDINLYSSETVYQSVFSCLGSNTISRLNLPFDTRRIDFSIGNQTDLYSILKYTRVLSSSLFIKQLSQTNCDTNDYFCLAQSFLSSSIDFLLKESICIVKELEDIVERETRFELKGSSLLKAKTKAKDIKFTEKANLIEEIMDEILHLFRCLTYFCRFQNGHSIESKILENFYKISYGPIPTSRSVIHPASNIIDFILLMIIYSLTDMPHDSNIYCFFTKVSTVFPKIMERDLSYVHFCCANNIYEMQMLKRYPLERNIRQVLFKELVSNPTIELDMIFSYIIKDMLYNLELFIAEPIDDKIKLAKYPIRAEALSMILFMIDNRNTLSLQLRRFFDILFDMGFISQEKLMIEENNEEELIESSIVLLKAMLKCKAQIEKKFYDKLSSLLETICLKLTKNWSIPSTPRTRSSIQLSSKIIQKEEKIISKPKNSNTLRSSTILTSRKTKK